MKSPHSRIARVLFSFSPLAATALVAACTTSPSSTEPTARGESALAAQATPALRAGIMRPPSRSRAKVAPTAPAPTASYAPTGGCGTPLVYYGGPIIAKPDVVQVSWNDPASSVASSIETYLHSWWPAIVSEQANYLSLLDQYSTAGVAARDGSPGSNQTFAGYGTYHGLYKITPSAANQGVSIDDTAIGPEIVAQIKAGKLPTPQFDANGFANTIYMVDFPPSVTSITMTFAGSSISSCNDFCGYHAGVQYSTGKYIYYGVHPDMTTGACATNCVTNGNVTLQQSVGMIHSHELAEATTDAEIFLEPLTTSSTDFVRPGGWDNIAAGCSEIGDSCAWPTTVPTVTYNGASYYVQGLFNNKLIDCEWQGGGAPPACTTNADCTNPATPVCSNGTCVGCTSDTQCTGNAAGGACQPSGACGECSATNHTACVAPTPVCNTASGTCVACTSNAQCSGNTPVCTSSDTCGPCTSNSDCSAPTPVCSASGACVECLTDSQCSGSTPICDATSHTCRGCTSNSDCAGGTNHACDVSNGQCVACVQNSDCSMGVCNTTSHSCVQCLNDSECSNPLPVCTGNACVACTSNSECSGSSNGKVCVPSAGCVQCGSNSDCPNGGMCTSSHTCTGSGSSSGGGSGSGSGSGSSSGGGSGSSSGAGSSSGGGSGSSSGTGGSSGGGSGSGGSVDAGDEGGGDGGNGATGGNGGGGGCSVGSTGSPSSDAGWIGLFLVGATLVERRRRQ
jgi:MYXO-CTERM domain-containing protein